MSNLPAEPRAYSICLPRPLWIGLAGVTFLVVAVGLRLGIPIYQQHFARETIERVGGHFESERSVPEWLNEWFDDVDGMSSFDDIVAVRMDDEQVADADLVPLRGLSRLRKLELDGARITDGGLKSLGGFRMLEWLDLTDTLMTEAGLAELRRMSHLENLDLPG